MQSMHRHVGGLSHEFDILSSTSDGGYPEGGDTKKRLLPVGNSRSFIHVKDSVCLIPS